MTLSVTQLAFLEDHHAAAMITVGGDGVAKVARVGIALVDGTLWSSGTQGRVRTRRLRRDPRCTLYVPDPGFAWLTLETTVEILEGPEAAAANLRLFRRMQHRPTGPLAWFGREIEEAEFLEQMRAEQRLIYQFTITRAYGIG
jgi:PPOX class probable F420-dependent enzyme